jgi:hypothetical protein
MSWNWTARAANTLSDERAKSLINDRLSFMRFLRLSLADRVPDARTIWFREKLTMAGAIKPLLERFDAAMREAGLIAMGGQIVDHPRFIPALLRFSQCRSPRCDGRTRASSLGFACLRCYSRDWNRERVLRK